MTTLSFVRSVLIPHSCGWATGGVGLVGVHPYPERVVRSPTSTPQVWGARRRRTRRSSVRSVLRSRIAKPPEEPHPGRRPDPPRDARRNHHRRPRRHRDLLCADNHDTLTIQEVERRRRPRMNRQGLPNAQGYENDLQLRRLVQQGHPRPVLGEGNCAAPIRPYRHTVPPSSRGQVLAAQDPCSRIYYLNTLAFVLMVAFIDVAAAGPGPTDDPSAWASPARRPPGPNFPLTGPPTIQTRRR